MTNYEFAYLKEKLNKIDLSGLPQYHISVLRNITLDPLSIYLRNYLFNIGLNGEIKFGEYGQLIQEAISKKHNVINEETDCILVFLKLEKISFVLSNRFASLSLKKITKEKERIFSFINSTIVGLRKKTNKMIIWHGFEFPTYPSYGIYEFQINNSQIDLIGKINDYVKQKLREINNAYFLDMNLCLNRIGAHEFYNTRYWYIGKAPYSLKALDEIANEEMKYIRASIGKNKKCLVLDCDNTLWGGLIGDDGIESIKIGKTYPGIAFSEFQHELVNLYNRGVILALCSKNNESDVWHVFKDHPDMILKEKHISNAKINWTDKATNLRKIANDLNIGLDSIVFVDDSEFEINLIRHELPEVEVIQLPKDEPSKYRQLLISCGLFDTLKISDEDKLRGEMYRSDIQRKEILEKVTDIEEYYKSLEMIVDIKRPDKFSIPRISQLTQKTNQFNLTTKRYNESEIYNFISNKSDVLSLRLSDKFGDLGIVGVSIITYEHLKAIIDAFLFSCRALGRGAEKVLLIDSMKMAAKKGCQQIIGIYSPTNKNKQVEYFYKENGFVEINALKEKKDHIFKFDLNKEIPSMPKYFKKIYSVE